MKQLLKIQFLIINLELIVFEKIENKDFLSIKTEKRNFPIVIKTPLYYNISKSGGYRVFSKDGYSRYVQANLGFYIRWKPYKNKPNFVK